ESNWGHRDFQSRALPTELGWRQRFTLVCPERVPLGVLENRPSGTRAALVQLADGVGEIGLADDGVAPVDGFRLVAGHFIATERGTPASSRFITALRRRSCGTLPGIPAAL